MDKALPPEVLAVLPLEPQHQLEVAHNIVWNAYSQKVCRAGHLVSQAVLWACCLVGMLATSRLPAAAGWLQSRPLPTSCVRCLHLWAV